MCGSDTWTLVGLGLGLALVVCLIGLVYVAWFIEPETW